MPDGSLRVSYKATIISCLGPPPQGEDVQICPPPSPPPTMGYRGCRNQRPQLGALGYHRFPLSKPVVGQLCMMCLLTGLLPTRFSPSQLIQSISQSIFVIVHKLDVRFAAHTLRKKTERRVNINIIVHKYLIKTNLQYITISLLR